MKIYDLFLLPLYLFVFLCARICELPRVGIKTLLDLRDFCEQRLILMSDITNFPPRRKKQQYNRHGQPAENSGCVHKSVAMKPNDQAHAPATKNL